MQVLSIAIVLLTTIVSLACGNALASNEPLIIDNNKLNTLMRDYTGQQVFAGNLVIAKDSEIVFSSTSGFSDAERNKPIILNDQFVIASLSKPITATLVLKLAEAGKLQLSQTLAEYFEPFTQHPSGNITLAQLLRHTSGLPNHFEIDGWFEPAFHHNTTDEEFIAAIAQLPLSFTPGSRYQYSNPGYFLLGKIIEKATQSTLAQAYQQYVFAPANMTSTELLYTSKNTQPVRAFQWQAGGGFRVQAFNSLRLLGAGGALISNARDLTQFVSALQHNKLINEQSLQQMLANDSPMSWRVQSVEVAPQQTVTLHHYDGKYDGYSALLAHIKEHDLTIVMLANNGISYRLKETLLTDLLATLYNQHVPSRTDDIVFKLIASLATDGFNLALTQLASSREKLIEREPDLSDLAYEMLWSGLADESLALFQFIAQQFEHSNNANENLTFACQHRLTKAAKAHATFCPKK